MKITTLPVYSKLAEAAEIPPELQSGLPKDWRLSKHQVETYQALTNGDYDVVFNTAMTGDGKSLAGQLPMLIQGGINWSMLAMYPTNELIADQYASFEKTKERWKADVVFNPMNGAELDRKLEDDNYLRRGDALIESIQKQ